MVNFYNVLGVPKTASLTQIKKAYHALSLIWSVDKPCPPGFTKEQQGEKARELNEAYRVLGDREDKRNREFYDKYGKDWETYLEKEKEKEKITCSECRVEIKGKKQWTKDLPNNLFCSEAHLKTFWNRRFKMKETWYCQACEGNHNENQGIPEKCEKIISIFSELKLLKNWELFSSDQKNYFFQRVRDGRIGLSDDDFDFLLKRTLQKAEELSKEIENENDQLRDQFIQKLKNLKGWKLISEERQDWFIEKIKENKDINELNNLIKLAEKEIKDLQEDSPKKKKKNENLTPYKFKIINYIKEFLANEPETDLEELESVNQNYEDAIRNATTKEEINGIGTQVLRNIQKIRDSKTQDQDPAIFLEALRAEAFNSIKKELKREPVLSENDISYPDWKKELGEANTKGKIIQIRESILSELKNKRENKQKEVKVIELISRGQSASTFEELSQIISKLKNFLSTDAFQNHQTEIEALETRLQTMNPTKYEEQVNTDLQNQVENSNLTEDKISAETKKAIDKAKKTNSPADKRLAEELICQDKSLNDLDEILNEVQNALTDDDLSEAEKEQLVNKIKSYINKDNYKRKAYQKMKDRTDQLLSQLLGEKQKQTPLSPKPTWPKVLGIGGLIVVPLLLVGLIITHQQKKLRRRK